ncbi:MAG: leukotoxin LktA family filamentous adhesin, partial [Cyanobacteriota bacterium]
MLLIFLISSSLTYAQSIIPDNNTNTNIQTSGNSTNISTKTIINNNAFNSFNKFNIDQGKEVNLLVPGNASNLINLIHSEKTFINGVLNSIQNNRIGGSVYLINPHGITIGSQGIINVGSLTAITPTKSFTDSFFKSPGLPDESSVNLLLNDKTPINSDSEISIQGQINAIESVRLESGSLTNTGKIQTGIAFSQDSIKTEDVINTEKIENNPQVTIKKDGIYIETVNRFHNEGTISSQNVTTATPAKVEIVSNDNLTMNNDSIIETLGDKGNIILSGKFISVGGKVSTDSKTAGDIEINSGTLSLAGKISAKSSNDTGGIVNIHATEKAWETTSSSIDVSGTTGGKINFISNKQITSSGDYKATGIQGKGGNIDITAPALKLLSTQIDASGKTDGGTIRLGGEYQGGKNLQTDEIPNAQILAISDGTNIKADSTGTNGNGGTIITWADQKASVFASYSAKPGTQTGDGGFIEISSGNNLTFGGKVEASVGNRTGSVLFDPKNITVENVSSSNQYSIVLGYNYNNITTNVLIPDNESYGAAVSIGDNNLAVGAYRNDGFDQAGTNDDEGAVYLYSFSDSNFSSPNFEAIIGEGYTSGKSYDITLDLQDEFGRSVSIDGNRIAIGAPKDDNWFNGATNKGAV